MEGDRFAIVKISGDVLNSAEDTARVAASLAFLHRIGLVPIVVHGAGLFTGRQAAEVAAAAAALPTDVSPAARRMSLMSAAQAHMRDANARLVAALAAEGVEASPLADGVFEAAPDADVISGGGSGGMAGAVGRITSVDVGAIAASVGAGRIPIVAALGCSPSSASAAGCLTFSTTEATVALSRAVKPLKVIWLRPEGGIAVKPSSSSSSSTTTASTTAAAGPTGTTLRSLNLARDAPSLAAKIEDAIAASSSSEAQQKTGGDRPPANGGRLHLPSSLADRFGGVLVDAADVSEIAAATGASMEDAAALAQLGALHAVLTSGDVAATVSVTSPEGLAGELFSHKGEGTLVVKGEAIRSLGSLEGVDTARVTQLLEQAFGAKLPGDYLQALAASGKLKRLYLSASYRGCAIVTTEPSSDGSAALEGVAYLDKFAVDPSSQGDKLGEVLWRAMTAEEPRLFWRSRATNRVNPWYYEQASGCFKSPAGDWTVFWRGLDAGQALPAIATALALKPTFPLKVYPQASGDDMKLAHPSQQPLLK